AGGQLRQDAAGELERGDGVLVDAALRADLPDAVDLLRLGEGLARRHAGDQPGHGGAVAADVEDAAPAERVAQDAALRAGRRRDLEAEARLDHPHVADGPFADQLDQLRRLRMAAV